MSDIIHVKSGTGKKLVIIDHVLAEKLTADDTNKAYAVGEIIVPPRAGPPMHHHAAQETFYIVEGTFTFRTLRDGAVHLIEAQKGDILHVPSHVPHTFKNTGATQGTILGWLTPTGMEVFFDKIGKPYTGEKLVAKKPSLWQLLRIGFLAKKFGISFVKEPR